MADTPVEATGVKKAIKPTKVMPTNRIAFAKQMELLRAYGGCYVIDQKPVTSTDAAKLIDLYEDTARLMNPFFMDLGLLTKGEGGFTPNPDVVAFHRAFQWKEQAPERKLWPTFKDTWFAKALTPRLAHRGVMEESEAIGMLAAVANAAPEYKGQLGLLLSYLESAGVVEREGTQLKAIRGQSEGPVTTDLPLTQQVVQAVGSAPGTSSAQAFAVGSKATEQHLLQILDPDAMSDEEQNAVWVLLKYLKKKKA